MATKLKRPHGWRIIWTLILVSTIVVLGGLEYLRTLVDTTTSTQADSLVESAWKVCAKYPSIPSGMFVAIVVGVAAYITHRECMKSYTEAREVIDTYEADPVVRKARYLSDYCTAISGKPVSALDFLNLTAFEGQGGTTTELAIQRLKSKFPGGDDRAYEMAGNLLLNVCILAGVLEPSKLGVIDGGKKSMHDGHALTGLGTDVLAIRPKVLIVNDDQA